MSAQNIWEHINKFVETAQDVQKNAAQILKSCSTIHDFVDNKLGSLLGVMKAYGVLYASVNVQDRKALEKQWSRLYRVPEIQDAVNNLLEFEQVLAELGCSVVLVSFGVRDGALLWLNETQSKFPLYLDPHRNLYKALNLPRSISKAYGHEALSYYGEAIGRGEDLPKQFANIDDDPQQLGGDFIVSQSNGQAVFSFIHRSKSSADRPKVEDIIEFIRGKNADN